MVRPQHSRVWGLAPAMLFARAPWRRGGTGKCGTTTMCDEAIKSIHCALAIRFFSSDSGSKDSTWLIEQTDVQQS
jgi:hypothetical protein